MLQVGVRRGVLRAAVWDLSVVGGGTVVVVRDRENVFFGHVEMPFLVACDALTGP